LTGSLIEESPIARGNCEGVDDSHAILVSRKRHVTKGPIAFQWRCHQNAIKSPLRCHLSEPTQYLAIQTRSREMRELPNPTFALSPLALPRGLFHRPAEYIPRHHNRQTALPPMERGPLVVSWAQPSGRSPGGSAPEVSVYSPNEMGARLSTSVPGHDIDLFDNYCEHLMVCDQVTSEVVGTYRLLTPCRRGASAAPTATWSLI
jgi:hypothetical protein